MLKRQTGITAKAESRLHPRYQQRKGARPFEGIVSDKSSDELREQMHSSILSWNAGPKRGNVTNGMVGSFHVMLVQEAETHFHEIVTSAEQQVDVYQGADQHILCNKSTFEFGSVKGLKYLLVETIFRRPPKHGNSMYTAASLAPEQRASEEARRCKATVDNETLWKVTGIL